MIVEDETWDSILTLTVPAPGDTDGPVEEISLPRGFYLKDMEGIAMDTRNFVYVVSSHSLNSEGKPRRGSALARLQFSSPPYQGGARGGLTFERADTISDLRPWLESEIPEIASVKNLSADDGGLNIEGLAYDPGRDRLLLGLRGPLFGNHPALIPIRLTSPAGPFSRQTMELEPPVILEGISGAGIRAISYNPEMRGFDILTGGSAKKGKNRSNMWFWRFFNQTDRGQLLPSSTTFKKTIGTFFKSYKFHPEGVCAVHLPTGQSFLLIVTDGSPYYFLKDATPQQVVE